MSDELGEPQADPEQVASAVDAADDLCRHCGRAIIPAPGVGRGWRHAVSRFISCHPGRPDTELAEP